MTAMSDSYAKTLALLDEGKAKDAEKEFHTNFAPTVKKFYSECATTYPVRYSKAQTWCDWSKELYASTQKADKALGDKDAAKAREMVEALREHYNKMDVEAQIGGVNGAIYAFYKEAAKDQPSADKLAEARKALDSAKPSHKAAAKPVEFAKSLAEWVGVVDPALADGALSDDELKQVREATTKFYRAYGLFE